MIAAKMIVGPAGQTSDSSPRKAIPLLVKTYDSSDGSGPIMLRVQADLENKSGTGLNCPNRWQYNFVNYSDCRQLFGQVSCHLEFDKMENSRLFAGYRLL